MAVIANGRLVDIGAVHEIGGADARIPIVRWRDGNGEQHEERTEHPATTVAALVARAGEPRDLEVIRPSLEDIYLELVKDADAEVAA